jgi:hypothetical protein
MVYVRFIARRTVRRAELKNAQRTRISGKQVFKNENVFLDVCAGKPTDFKSPPMVRIVAAKETDTELRQRLLIVPRPSQVKSS